MTIVDREKKSKEPYNRKNPFPAKLLDCYSLSRPGSSKEVLHVSLDLADSDLNYQTGSSIGIYPHNPPAVVEKLLSLLLVLPETVVYDKRSERSLFLKDFLTKKINTRLITSHHIQLIQKYTPNKTLEELLADPVKLKAFIDENTLLTLLSSFWKLNIPIQELCDIIPPMMPRYYSVASSRAAIGNKVDLMIASFSYMVGTEKRESITASYLRDFCTPGISTVDIFLQENEKFALPTDPSAPIILIGPGTGLAALRGFIQERVAKKSSGKNWLFTGDRTRTFDFHYEEELLEWKSKNFLRLDVAFSREGEKKLYVQDKMQENSQDLYSWIVEEKAHIYISGDAKNMAKDVQAAFKKILEEHGDLSEEEASTYLKEMRKTGRLLLDVY
jgi:sulfite reductase (NADPH) flavoprotein alpha-component